MTPETKIVAGLLTVAYYSNREPKQPQEIPSPTFSDNKARLEQAQEKANEVPFRDIHETFLKFCALVDNP